jgi:hypothetical protein
VAEAVQVVDRWLEQPNLRLLAPGEDHWAVTSFIFDNNFREF